MAVVCWESVSVGIRRVGGCCRPPGSLYNGWTRMRGLEVCLIQRSLFISLLGCLYLSVCLCMAISVYFCLSGCLSLYLCLHVSLSVSFASLGISREDKQVFFFA